MTASREFLGSGQRREGHVALSIVIPHLNEPEDLRRCLTSIAAQTIEGVAVEIIVVDNGSRTLPHDVCGEFPGVKLVSEPVPGPGPARNRGAMLACADLIAFIDADCMADAGWIAEIVRFFEENPDVDIVGGDVRLVPSPSHRSLDAVEAYERVFSYRVQQYVEKEHYAATGNMAVRRHVFQRVGPFGGIGIAEDREWGKRATGMGFRLAFVGSIRVFTPPCRSFAELAGRWNRAIAHDYHELGYSTRKFAWAARSVALAGSSLFEIPRLLRTDRLSSVSERISAFRCLVRLRLHRSAKMLRLLLADNSRQTALSWNRESDRRT